MSGDDLDPNEVTEALGRAPTFAAKRGELRKSGQSTIRQPTGVWLFQLGDSKEWVLADAIRTLLKTLPPPTDVWAQLARRFELRISAGLFLEQWNRGCELSSELVAELAARHLGLDLDIYSDVEGDA